MRLSCYSMLDKKVGYMHPTFEQSDDVAIRNFAYAISKNEYYGVNASDFALYRIGYFDTESGQLSREPAPVFLVEGQGFAKPVVDTGFCKPSKEV